MLDKDPLTRITTKHLLKHPFMSQAQSRLGMKPEKSRPKDSPLYTAHVSQAVKKIITKEVVDLKVQPKQNQEA